MNADRLNEFAVTIVGEILRIHNDHDESLQISLFDPKTGHETYAALFDHFEAAFEVCELSELVEDQAEDDILTRDMEAVATFNTAEEAAVYLIDLALRHGLLPRVDQIRMGDP